MVIKGTDKFEYKYQEFYNSIKSTENWLNILGSEGWELIELIKPKTNGDIHKGWLKRKIRETKV